MLVIVGTYRKRQYVDLAVASIRNFVKGVTELAFVDDSGDEANARRLRRYGDVIETGAAGYSAAMQAVWARATGEHVMFFEEDFRAIAPIDLDGWAAHLDTHPYLAQVVALRQPWFANEVDAGGVLEALDGDRTLIEGFIEHRLFFSGNPTVLPRRTLDLGWPNGTWSENQFRDRLLADPAVRFAITPNIRVEHVGERSGFGY